MAVLGVEPPITLTIAILLLAPFGVYPFFREFCMSLPDLVVGAIPKGATARQKLPAYRSARLATHPRIAL